MEEERAVELNGELIVSTVQRLRDRIRERFPDANLLRVAASLLHVAERTAARAAEIARPYRLLRLAIALLVALIPLGLAAALGWLQLPFAPARLGDFVAFFQAGVESFIFIGLGIAFSSPAARSGRRS